MFGTGWPWRLKDAESTLEEDAGGIHCSLRHATRTNTRTYRRSNDGGIPVPEVLRVSADSKPKAVAGALAAVFREKGSVELQAVGAGAVNQAGKAIAITRGFVAPHGVDLGAVPAVTQVPA